MKKVIAITGIIINAFGAHAQKVDSGNVKMIVMTSSSLVVAATCNAAMDEMTDHYATSVFAKFNNPKFFDHTKGSLGTPVFGYHVDAWHISKTTMLLTLSVPVAELMHDNLPLVRSVFWDRVIWYSITGIIWNVTFNTAYSNLFEK